MARRFLEWLASTLLRPRDTPSHLSRADLEQIAQVVGEELDRRRPPERHQHAVLWRFLVLATVLGLVIAFLWRPDIPVRVVVPEFGDRWGLDSEGISTTSLSGDVASLSVLAPAPDSFEDQARDPQDIDALPIVASISMSVPGGCDAISPFFDSPCRDGELRLLAPVTVRWSRRASIEGNGTVSSLSIQRRSEMIPCPGGSVNPYRHFLGGFYECHEELIGFSGEYIGPIELTAVSSNDVGLGQADTYVTLDVQFPFSDPAFEPAEPLPVVIQVVAIWPGSTELVFSRPTSFAEGSSPGGVLTATATGFTAATTSNIGGLVTVGVDQTELLRPMTLETEGRDGLVGISFDSSLETTREMVLDLGSGASAQLNQQQLVPTFLERWNAIIAIVSAAVISVLVVLRPRRSSSADRSR